MILPGKILYFDVETTGFHSHENSIITLSCIFIRDGVPEGKKTFKMCPKELIISKLAYEKVRGDSTEVIKHGKDADKTYNIQQKIHGILPSQAVKFDRAKDVFKNEMLPFFKKLVNPFDKEDRMSAAGHNVDFDMRMLKGLFESQAEKYFYSYFGYPVYDTLSLVHQLQAAGHEFAENCKLETLCRFFNIPLKAHDSASDIMATYMLHLKLLEYIREVE